MSQNEQQLHADKARGERAKELIENPLLVEAFDKVKQDLLAAWLATKPAETDAREQLHRAYALVDDVRQVLVQVVGNGAIASQTLDKLKKRA